MGIQSIMGRISGISPEMRIEQEELGILVPTQLEDFLVPSHRRSQNFQWTEWTVNSVSPRIPSHVHIKLMKEILWIVVGSLNYELLSFDLCGFCEGSRITDPHTSKCVPGLVMTKNVRELENGPVEIVFVFPWKKHGGSFQFVMFLRFTRPGT